MSDELPQTEDLEARAHELARRVMEKPPEKQEWHGSRRKPNVSEKPIESDGGRIMLVELKKTTNTESNV